MTEPDEGQFITDQINADPEEVARLRRSRISAREGRLVARMPYQKTPCCCGDPECNDFEERMAAWGVPLDELVTEVYVIPLPPPEEGPE